MGSTTLLLAWHCAEAGCPHGGDDGSVGVVLGRGSRHGGRCQRGSPSDGNSASNDFHCTRRYVERC
jgi:hypothetical protein